MQKKNPNETNIKMTALPSIDQQFHIAGTANTLCRIQSQAHLVEWKMNRIDPAQLLEFTARSKHKILRFSIWDETFDHAGMCVPTFLLNISHILYWGDRAKQPCCMMKELRKLNQLTFRLEWTSGFVCTPDLIVLLHEPPENCTVY